MRSVCILVLLFFSLTSFAEQTVAVHFQHRPPQLTIQENNFFSGPIYDITIELIKKMNWKADYQAIPWIRTLAEARTGKDILLVRHSMTKERKSFLSPILYGFEKRRVYFYMNTESWFKLNKLEDLYGLRIGHRRGSFYFEKFNTDNFKNKVGLTNDIQLIKMLLNKRIDIAIFNDPDIFIKNIEKLKKEDSKINSTLLKESDFKYTFHNARYFSIPKFSKLNNKFEKINCQMYKMRKSGFISRAFKKYNLKVPGQNFSSELSIDQKKLCK